MALGRGPPITYSYHLNYWIAPDAGTPELERRFLQIAAKARMESLRRTARCSPRTSSPLFSLPARGERVGVRRNRCTPRTRPARGGPTDPARPGVLPSGGPAYLGRRGRLAAGPRKLIELLVTVSYAASGQVVWADLDLDLVAGKYPNTVHSHLARVVRQHLMTVGELHLEHGVLQRLAHRTFEHDCVFFSLGQDNSSNLVDGFGNARALRERILRGSGPGSQHPSQVLRLGDIGVSRCELARLRR